jgi:hypothetical protein
MVVKNWMRDMMQFPKTLGLSWTTLAQRRRGRTTLSRRLEQQP